MLALSCAFSSFMFRKIWPERRELNPHGRLVSPIPNRFTHYALRRLSRGGYERRWSSLDATGPESATK
jgi:hypothetical protein